MRRTISKVLGLVLLTAVGRADAGPGTPPGGQEKKGEEYRVTAIHARFFLHATGVLETEEESRARGWNTVLEAETVLVSVDISGPAFPPPKFASLEFTADAGKSRLASKSIALQRAYFSESGHATIPFLVYGVGCVPIRLTAALRISGRHQRVTHEIPLACGE